MRNTYFTISVALLLLTTSCSAPRLIIDSDQLFPHDLSEYDTFHIIKEHEGISSNVSPINKQRLINAIHNKLIGESFKRSKNNADLKILWYVKSEHKLDTRVYKSYYQRWGESRNIEVIEYDKGTLVIDIIDAKKDEIVWHGRATALVDFDSPSIEKTITKAVNSLLDQWLTDNKPR